MSNFENGNEFGEVLKEKEMKEKKKEKSKKI